MDPASLKYAKTHEWVAVSGDVATIGISDFAVKELTDVVHLELPDVGRTVRRGDAVGEIESVKAVSDIYAPIDGRIVAVNSALTDDPAKLSDDPYGAGWMIKIQIADASQLSGLLDHAAYLDGHTHH